MNSLKINKIIQFTITSKRIKYLGIYLTKEDLYTERAMRVQKRETIATVSKTAAAAAKSLQSCPNLCDPIDRSPPGFPVPGILQARMLEWVAISFSNA